MSNILRERKTEITVACILTIAISIVYCTYILVVAPNLNNASDSVPQPPPPTYNQNGQLVQQPTSSVTPTTSPGFDIPTPLIGTIIFVFFIATGAVGGFLGVRHFNQAKLRRDQQRLSDLPAIAQAFQSYKDKVGTYPVSTTYRSDYYTGINLSNDWHYYGLPNDDQMRQFLPNWPVSDPGIDYHGKSQVNQYLYYPHDNGARFDLYAHLELHQSAPDYNQQDNLPQAWGQFNYKISSDAPAPAVTPIVVVAEQPAVAVPQPSALAQPQPVASPVPTPAPMVAPLPAPTNDTDIEPQAATAAASASLDQNVAEQKAMGAIDQLFAQDQPVQPTQPQPPVPATPAEPALSQPAHPAMDPNQTNSNQLDQMAQAMAARAQMTDGSTTPEIKPTEPPQKT